MSLERKQERKNHVDLWNEAIDLFVAADSVEDDDSRYAAYQQTLCKFIDSFEAMYINPHQRVEYLRAKFSATFRDLLKVMESVSRETKDQFIVTQLKRLDTAMSKLQYPLERVEKNLLEFTQERISRHEPAAAETSPVAAPAATASCLVKRKKNSAEPHCTVVTLAKKVRINPIIIINHMPVTQINLRQVIQASSAVMRNRANTYSIKNIAHVVNENVEDKDRSNAMRMPEVASESAPIITSRAAFLCYQPAVKRLLLAVGAKKIDAELRKLQKEEFERFKNLVQADQVERPPDFKQSIEYISARGDIRRGAFESAIGKLRPCYLAHLQMAKQAGAKYQDFYNAEGKKILVELLRAIDGYCANVRRFNEYSFHVMDAPLTKEEADLFKEKYRAEYLKYGTLEEGELKAGELHRADFEFSEDVKQGTHKYSRYNRPTYVEYLAAHKKFMKEEAHLVCNKRFPLKTKDHFRVFASENSIFASNVRIEDIPNPDDIHHLVGAALIQRSLGADAVSTLITKVLAEGAELEKRYRDFVNKNESYAVLPSLLKCSTNLGSHLMCACGTHKM